MIQLDAAWITQSLDEDDMARYTVTSNTLYIEQNIALSLDYQHLRDIFMPTIVSIAGKTMPGTFLYIFSYTQNKSPFTNKGKGTGKY